jgi:hypothetical protein
VIFYVVTVYVLDAIWSACNNACFFLSLYYFYPCVDGVLRLWV